MRDDFNILMWIFCGGALAVISFLIAGKPEYATPLSIISGAALIASVYEKWKEIEDDK